MKRQIIETTIVVLSFSVGVTVGKLTDWGYFELSREISVIEALTLFATIGLAIYISRVLEREAEAKRVEKGIYLSKVTELEAMLRGIEELFEESPVSYTRITSRIKTCRMRKDSLCRSMGIVFRRPAQPKLMLLESRLTEGLKLIKTLLTESTEPLGDVCVTDDKVSYSPERHNEIDVAINDIVEQLFMMKIWIGNL